MQVDSVLNRLKVSLGGPSGDEQDKSIASSDIAPTASNNVTTDALHEYIASGGLNQNKPWQMHPQQQNELIGLIDRLQSSLHDLQSVAPAATSPPLQAGALPPHQPAAAPAIECAPKARQKSPPTAPPAPLPSPPPPPPPPLPPDSKHSSKPVGWRAAFLKSSSGPVVHRPVWCRRDSQHHESEPSAPSTVSKQSTTEEGVSPRVLKETPGLRGRFIPQQLRPAPKITPKPVAPLKLPPHILSKVSPAKESNKEPVAPPSMMSPLKLSTPHKVSSTKPSTTKEVNPKARDTSEKSMVKKAMTAVAKVTTPLSRTKGSGSTESEKNNRKQGSGRGGGSGGDIPWKVKLAKKRSERSQTELMDGTLSIDLRKSINQAALRKSMEDLRVIDSPPIENRPSIFTATHQMPSTMTQSKVAYPILKQKSLGELYTSKPKPFRRGDTIIGFLPTKKTDLNEKKDAPESTVISTLCWTPTITCPSGDERVHPLGKPEAQFSSSLVITPKMASTSTTESSSTQSLSPTVVRSPLKRQEAISHPLAGPQSEDEELLFQSVPATSEEHVLPQTSVVEVIPLNTTVQQILMTSDIVTDIDKPGSEESSNDQPPDQLNNQATNEPINITSDVVIKEISKRSIETQVSFDTDDGEKGARQPTLPTSKESMAAEMNLTDEESVTTGILQFSPNIPVSSVKPVHLIKVAAFPDPSCIHHDSGISESTTPDPVIAKSEGTEEKEVKNQDPSQMLFTPSESIQIAIHKAAINKQISEEEARRRDGIKVTPVQPELPVESPKPAQKPAPKPAESVPITNSGSNSQIFKKVASEKGSKERSRRSNTIAITLPELAAASKNHLPWKPSSFSATFQVKTENDRKFQNLFSHNHPEDSNSAMSRRILLPIESEPPGGSGMKWTNKFSSIRSAFESKPDDDTKSPVRSRRTSGEDSAGSHVTTANLRVQMNSGNVSMKTSEQKTFFSSTVVTSRSPQPLGKTRLHSLAPFSNPQCAPDPPLPVRDTGKRTCIKELKLDDVKPINTQDSIINNVKHAVITKKDPIITTSKETLSKDIKPIITRNKMKDELQEPVDIKKDPPWIPDKEPIPVNQSIAVNKQQSQLSKKLMGDKVQLAEGYNGVAKISSLTRTQPSISCSRQLRKDFSSSSVWTTASVGSFDFKDEKEEEDDYGDDEASSSSSSDEDDHRGAPSPAESTGSRINSSGINRLSKLIKKYSSTEDVNQDSSPLRPQVTAPAGRFAWNPPTVSISSPGVFKSLSNQFISAGDWGRRSDDISNMENPITPPPIPPRELKPNPPLGNANFQRPQTLCGLKSSSASALNTLAGYVEPPGPTLVGLVARNVRSIASTNSITNSAMNFTVSVAGLPAHPENDCSPTSLIMKSVSSSRIVSEAKEQLSKRPDFLQLAPGVRSRPQSLVVPSPSPSSCGGDGGQKRVPGRVVGNKQYEASMSPESAEKKQRELLKFFNDSVPAVSPAERSSSASKVGTSPVQVRFRARSAVAAARPRAVSEGASLGFPSPPDEISSDVDELFDRLLASDSINDANSGAGMFQKSSRENASSLRNAAAEVLDQTSVNGDPSSQLSAKSKFNDRRRAWEQSSKIHLNESISLISE